MFEPVTLKWDGIAYTVPADRVLMAIATIESVLTLDELHRFTGKQTVPLAKVAMAYGALLRFAGADISDDAVYSGMFGGANVDPLLACSKLLGMMIPPEHMRRHGGAEGKPRPDDMSSSGPSINSPSAKNGSRRKSSGV